MRRNAFTLIELLVTISIIAIMAAMVYGALHAVQKTAAEAATKATIAKLNNIIMLRYDSYTTRRVSIRLPASIEALPANSATRQEFVAKWSQPKNAARKRLDAIRDTIRMEMPDARTDVTDAPIEFEWGRVVEPTIHKIYASNPPTAGTGTCDPAQCLYMIVSKLCPEAMGQFAPSEIGKTADGKPCFVDGWGRPIMWLRWGPGFKSDLQTCDYNTDHDPFDSQRIEGLSFRLVPLIYSAGPDGEYGIGINSGAFMGDPFNDMELGKADSASEDNITNHAIDAR